MNEDTPLTGLHNNINHHHDKRMTTPNGMITTAILLVLWSLIATSIGLSLHYPSWPVYLFSVLIIGTCQRYFEELSHQANHRNLFQQTKLNDSLDFFYAIPLFYTSKETRDEHYSHHLNLPQEQAKANYSYDHLGISGKWLKYKWYKFFILAIQPFIGLQALIECKNILWNVKTYLFNCYFYHFILIAILMYFHHADYYLYYWLVPYFSVFCLFYYYSELFTHFGCRDNFLCRDTVQWFVNWFIAPLGFCQHHSLHHIAPKVTWFKYSHVKNDYPKNSQSLRQTFRSIFHLVSSETDHTP